MLAFIAACWPSQKSVLLSSSRAPSLLWEIRRKWEEDQCCSVGGGVNKPKVPPCPSHAWCGGGTEGLVAPSQPLPQLLLTNAHRIVTKSSSYLSGKVDPALSQGSRTPDFSTLTGFSWFSLRSKFSACPKQPGKQLKTASVYHFPVELTAARKL